MIYTIDRSFNSRLDNIYPASELDTKERGKSLEIFLRIILEILIDIRIFRV
ncbi:MAG: hypothetical protein C5S40_00205 [ANME-2 cluster archaeon]|nr:hypothetical protein [ANME-2 cluster archaeon]